METSEIHQNVTDIYNDYTELLDKVKFVIKDVITREYPLYDQYKISVLNYIQNVLIYIENSILKLDKFDKLSILQKQMRKDYIKQMQYSLTNYDYLVTSLKFGNVSLNIKQISSLLSLLPNNNI